MTRTAPRSAKRLYPGLAAMAVGCSAFFGLVGWPPTSQAEEVDLKYTISSDPAVEVLRLSQEGGYLSGWERYSLYGDGRLVRNLLDAGHQRVIESSEVQLSFEETVALVDLPVRGGLMEYSAKAQPREVRYFHETDMPNTVVQLRLDTYAKAPPTDGLDTAVYRTARIHSVSDFVQSFPEHREARAMLELHSALRQAVGLSSLTPQEESE